MEEKWTHYPRTLQFESCNPFSFLFSYWKNRLISLNLYEGQVIAYETDEITNETRCISCSIPDEAELELRHFFTIKHIREYRGHANSTMNDPHFRGYRDECYYVKYTYIDDEGILFTGKLNWIFDDSPFEQALIWLRKWFPEFPQV